MRTTGVEGAYAIPLRVIPSLGQRPENSAHSSTEERCHVLQQRDRRSNQAKGANTLPEESRTGSGKSGAWARKTEILAGEAEGDGIKGSQAGDLFWPHGTNVLKISDMRPVLSEDAIAFGRGFAERHGLEARALKAKAETANA